MSDVEKDNDNLQEQDSQSKKKKKLLILVAAIFVLILTCAGGYLGYAYLKHLPPFEPTGPTPEEIAMKKAQQEEALKEQVKDIYVKFDSAFTFNLKDKRNRDHVLQMEIVLMTIGQENSELCKKHLSLTGSVISSVVSAQTFESLTVPTGRQRLKELLLEAVRSKLSGVTNKVVVDQILFTNFVLQ